ncbi:MAG: A/G-specific adenine glycosylase, partial [Myxococcota bacterium]|nr:A/G-specific adenine glycosylase [Myxococcota bacterium]
TGLGVQVYPAAMNTVAAALLAWFEPEARPMPWRRDVSPYRTWISEIMLQQTRVETVIPYFERFVARFPSPEDLAGADVDEVLRFWSGLGYYSRARSLHRAAQVVVERGGIPGTAAQLRELPGIGAYTAGAIASIACGQDEVAVDGNVERVMSRLHCRGGSRRDVEKQVQAYLPKGEASLFNQALMDLGATICIPGRPRCDACPLQSHCLAHRTGRTSEFPASRKRVAAKPRSSVWGAWYRDDSLLFVRRPDAGLLGGTYALPGGDLAGQEPLAALTRAFEQRLGVELLGAEELGVVTHVFTHIRLSLHLLCVEARGEPCSSHYPDLCWAPVDGAGLALSTLTRKALTLAGSERT